jgi:hypothetical protein
VPYGTRMLRCRPLEIRRRDSENILARRLPSIVKRHRTVGWVASE